MKMNRVLIVDDNEDNLYFLRTLLQGHGYEVVTATHGADALDMARQNPPDLIIADILMPVMDGFVLCREWKKDGRLKPIPFVFYTATYTDERDRELALSLGAERFIVKPEEPDAFMAVIRETIQQVGSLPAAQTKPAADARARIPIEAPEKEESVYLKQYSEALIRRLEAKTEQLEQAKRELEQKLDARTQAEALLARERDLLHALMDNIPDKIFFKDAEGRFVRINRAHAASLGLKDPAEAVGKTEFDVHPPEQAQEACQDEKTILETGRPLIGKIEKVSASGGEVRWNLVTKVPIKDQQGQVAGIVGISRDITRRRQVEEALQESEEHFRSLFENMLNGYAYCQMHFEQERPVDFTYISVNRAFEMLTGLKGVVGRRVSEVIPGLREANPELFEIYGRVALTGKPEWFETYLDALGAWFSISVYSPKQEHFVAVFDVITERKLAEEALREYEKLVEGSQDLIAVVDRQYHYVLANGAHVRYQGRERDQVVGHSVAEVMGKDTFEGHIKKNLDECFAGKGVLYEMKHAFPQRGERDLLISYFPIEGPEVVDQVAVVVRDVTEHKRAEEALVEERHLFHTLMDNLPHAIYFKDRESRFTRINSAVAKLIGLDDLGQAIGKTDFDFFPDGLAREYLADEREIMRTGQPIVGKEERETWPDGRVTWVATTKMPLRDASGNIIGTFGISHDITGRKRMEEALRESETRFRTLTEEAPLAIRISRDGLTLYVNRKYRDMYGYSSADELVGRPLREQWAPESWPTVEERIRRRPRGLPLPTNMEGIAQRRDGSHFPVHADVARVNLADGPAILTFLADISERKQAEEALKESEEKFRKAFMTGADGFFIGETDGAKLIEVNDCFANMFGYTREEVIGKIPSELGLYDNPAVRQKLISEYVSKGEVRNLELKGRKRSGEPLTALVSISVLQGSEGRLALGVVRDITEHKLAEATLVRLRHAVDASGEVIYMTNPEGIFSFVNPEFTHLYGYTESEVVGKVTPRILQSGTMTARDYSRFWETLMSKRVARGEVTNKAQDGRLVYVQSSVSPVLNEQGAITGFLAIQRDVTERKRLEQQFLQAQKMEAVGRLAAGVAHDFNNLLTIINGHSELMLKRLAPDNPARGSLAEIKDAGERAGGLTRQLLAFSRQQVRTSRVLDLNALVTNSIKMLQRLIGEDVELVFKPGPDLGMVSADPAHIEQVLMNLAVNSRDAMPDGGKLTIEISNLLADQAYATGHYPMPPGPYVMLAVSDTGCGMDEKTRSQVFEPFFTTKGPGKGTGLGLATVYGIVKQNGGYIWVYSELGKGTTFKIYLPVVEGGPEATKEIGLWPAARRRCCLSRMTPIFAPWRERFWKPMVTRSWKRPAPWKHF